MATKRHCEGKVALVTGGVRRLGKGMALAFARDGASVVINARSSRDEAEKAAKEVEALGVKAMVHIADITKEAEVKAMVDAVIAKFGRHRHPGQQRRHPRRKAVPRDELPGMALGARRRARRRVLLLARGAAAHGQEQVGAHHQPRRRVEPSSARRAAPHVGAAKIRHRRASPSRCRPSSRRRASPSTASRRAGSAASARRPPGAGIGHNPPVGREGNFDDVASMVRQLASRRTASSPARPSM